MVGTNYGKPRFRSYGQKYFKSQLPPQSLVDYPTAATIAPSSMALLPKVTLDKGRRQQHADEFGDVSIVLDPYARKLGLYDPWYGAGTDAQQRPRALSDTPQSADPLRRVFQGPGSRSDVQYYPGSRVVPT